MRENGESSESNFVDLFKVSNIQRRSFEDLEKVFMATEIRFSAVLLPHFKFHLLLASACIAHRWIEGKRIDDNAEGLWRIHDKLYDVTSFIDRHPGGAEWLSLTKGIDITEQFETHHIGPKAEQMLSKFYVRDAALPRNYNLTFDDAGFYRTLKRKVASKIDTLDMKPVKISKMISDLMLGLVFGSAVLAVKDNNIYLALLSGLFLLWMLVIAHNYFHQKNNWRMLCFNLSLLNYREWRVSHAMSHHLYTNSYYDLEISMFEPWLQWIPRPKTTFQKIAAPIFSPIVWTILINYTAVARSGKSLQSQIE